MKHQILSKLDQHVIFEADTETLKACVELAVKQGVSLFYANLYNANLAHANLTEANLTGANLTSANLTGADLTSANLTGASLAFTLGLSSVKGLDTVKAELQVVPAEGEVIGWKKCKDNVLVKLLVPADAKRSNSTTRKCRASHAKVLEVVGAEAGYSMVPSGGNVIKYVAGETVTADSFDDYWLTECSHGIHFFLTRKEAEEFFK